MRKQQTPQPEPNAKREARAQRILDAASTLILRWGYNKTTVDDIARQAGVAKGTIYLHWKTREDLFLALMQRERLALNTELQAQLAADPTSATLRGIIKHSSLGLMRRPLLKAAFLADMDVIGKMIHTEQSSRVLMERLTGFNVYLEFLREHQLVRTDLSLRQQVYMLGAIFMGFLLLAPLMPEDWTLADEELAEMMAETVHRALEPERAIAPEEFEAASSALMQYVSGDIAAGREQLRQNFIPETPGESHQ